MISYNAIRKNKTLSQVLGADTASATEKEDSVVAEKDKKE